MSSNNLEDELKHLQEQPYRNADACDYQNRRCHREVVGVERGHARHVDQNEPERARVQPEKSDRSQSRSTGKKEAVNSNEPGHGAANGDNGHSAQLRLDEEAVAHDAQLVRAATRNQSAQ
jgi:hypothetical protein